jgi:hypothetical protein
MAIDVREQIVGRSTFRRARHQRDEEAGDGSLASERCPRTLPAQGGSNEANGVDAGKPNVLEGDDAASSPEAIRIVHEQGRSRTKGEAFPPATHAFLKQGHRRKGRNGERLNVWRAIALCDVTRKLITINGEDFEAVHIVHSSWVSLTFRAKWANEAATYERAEVRRPLDRTLRA